MTKLNLQKIIVKNIFVRLIIITISTLLLLLPISIVLFYKGVEHIQNNVGSFFNKRLALLPVIIIILIIEISLLVVSLIIYSLGILSGVLLMMSSFFEAQSKYSKLRKQYDKTSIGADDAEDKIKLLENKIQTLEIALKKQMEK